MLMKLEVLSPSPHLEVLSLLQVPLLAMFFMIYFGYFAVTTFEGAGCGGLLDCNEPHSPILLFSLTSLGNIRCGFLCTYVHLLNPVSLSP